MSENSDDLLCELRLTRAYIKLLCIPEDSTHKTVSLTRVGQFEVRMFDPSELAAEGALFWLELLDIASGSSVDSFLCEEIKAAVPIYKNFVSQAAQCSRPAD